MTSNASDAVNPSLARLVLKDGSVFEGVSFGAERSIAGEVVFNTGMVGYPESLTDPSYKGQILVLTFPLVGNYGVPDDVCDEFGLPLHFESNDIHVAGLIIQDYSHDYSHHEACRSLSQWLKEHNVPALYSIDTRMLTKKIRTEGSLLGKIEFGDQHVEFCDPNERNLIAEVSRKNVAVYGSGDVTIVAVDCGIKFNIIRCLVALGVTLKVVPWDYDFTQEQCDGIFLSNGPGDPEKCDKTVEHLRKALQNDTPIFGICMGHQLLARAMGCRTYKMKFGNRGMNQPVVDCTSTKCYITPQNHGYAVDHSDLPDGWKPYFVNKNDHSNEGLFHEQKPFFCVQFHPEHMGGPTDTEFLFDKFLRNVREKRMVGFANIVPSTLDVERELSKVLLLGSGGLSIGQAGEFDYSGSQAIKALKEDNIKSVLINPNIATVQTSASMADVVYFQPVTPEFVEKVIEKERPDGILLQFGGQTALNCGMQLEKSGVLAKYGVHVLGTPVATIEMTEDREVFAKQMELIGESVAPSGSAETIEDAVVVATRLGYPVLVRAAFALGGLGSGFANNEKELRELVLKAFASSSQVIIDKSLRGWKEIEYEVVRDKDDNCITVCNMENFDPLGVHTGDSIVVAPSQTLSNREYYRLRRVALKVIRHLGVVGECNIQYAVSPNSDEYCIIEVNARLSRSSALASKATGYPLAYVAAKLALGRSLTTIKNSVTKKTTACFEPSLDYVVVKWPRWDMRKFANVSSYVGSAMKSVGEVMGIGRSFEEAFQKALRMVSDDATGFTETNFVNGMTNDDLDHIMQNPNDRRAFMLADAFERGYTVDRLHELTRIDRWFLCKLRNVFRMGHCLKEVGSLSSVSERLLRNAKKLGCSDSQIGSYLGSTELEVRRRRQALGVIPFVKQIDTLAAEFPAYTNYLYMTYNGEEHDLTFEDHGIMVLGCGTYRIGSSCEFDWCAVSCNRTLKKLNRKSIMVNYNPETVSTDYDECDRLYFEELSFERVMDIYETEHSSGVIVSVGGQIPNNLAFPLSKQGVKILGTQPSSIDRAEDRNKFSQMLDDLGVDQPRWSELTSMESAKQFAKSSGFPVLVRPSYVLSGAAMNVAATESDLMSYLEEASDLSPEHPVVISKFIMGAKEIEFDGVGVDGKVLNYAISEHVENAGVHSGDATLVLPAQKLYAETIKRVKKIAFRICRALQITGPFNIQFLSKDNEIKVIECNLRASRSFPFVSKTFEVDFIALATRAMIGVPVKPALINLDDVDYVCIKAPMFSFSRLQGADPVLRVEMASTGEVACFGDDKHEAFLKSMLATGFKLPNPKTRPNILISAGPVQSKADFLESAHILLALGFKLFGTNNTVNFFRENGVEITLLHKPDEKKQPAILDYLIDEKIHLVINIPENLSKKTLTNGYLIRRKAVDFHIPLITNIKLAVLMAHSLEYISTRSFSVKSWREYVDSAKQSYY